MMKKIAWTLGILLLAGCTKTQAPDAQATKDTQAQNSTASLRVATEGAYPPFNYTRADGTLVGLDIDVMNAICQEMQVKCEINAQEWDGIIPALLSQKYDLVIAGMAITEERKQAVDFSEPYFSNKTAWLAKKGFDVTNIQNQVLAGQRATTMGEYLQANYEGKNGNSVKLYDNYDNAYLDLKAARVGAVLVEEAAALIFVKNNADYAVVGDIGKTENLAIAMRKDDPIKARVNDALAKLAANGQLQAIIDKNLK